MENYVACCRQHVDYFKATFSDTTPPTYEARAINFGIQINNSSQATSVVARNRRFFNDCSKLAKLLSFFNENRIYQSIYISFKISSWEATGIHCVHLVSILLFYRFGERKLAKRKSMKCLQSHHSLH